MGTCLSLCLWLVKAKQGGAKERAGSVLNANHRFGLLMQEGALLEQGVGGAPSEVGWANLTQSTLAEQGKNSGILVH